MSGLASLIPAAQYGGGPGVGPGGGMGPGAGWGGHMYMPFGGLWLVLLLVIGGLLVWMFLRGAARRGPARDDRTPLELLKERYARGEIDREAYLLIKRDLEGGGKED